MKQQKSIKILLVCDNKANIEDIESRVRNLDDVLCYIWQYPSLSEGIACLDIKKLQADIIILDLGLKGSESPKEIYYQMGLSAHKIPIIVITGKGEKEHSLAIYVMESGAADNMIRGQFKGLTDAIQFALIRSEITKNQKTETDKTLQDSKDSGRAQYQESCKQRSKDKKENKNTLSMFMDGYSVSNHLSKDKKDTK